MKTLILTIIIFAAAMTMLGLGALFGRKSLRGHCGSAKPVETSGGTRLMCDRCESDYQKGERNCKNL